VLMHAQGEVVKRAMDMARNKR